MKLVPLVALGLIAVTPAFAGNVKKSDWRAQECRNVSVGDQECGPSPRADRFRVYSYDGRLIGRDPDPNVRMRIRDDDAKFRNR